MLRPERMVHFRVVVPSEHEIRLISALVSLGCAHLNPHLTRIEHRMPPLLQKIAEHRLKLKDLDMDEARAIASKLLAPNDELRAEIERVYRRYKRLMFYKEVVEKLNSMGITPRMLIRGLRRIEFRAFIAFNSVVPRVQAEFRKAGVLCKVVKLSHGTLVVACYLSELEEQVDEVASKLRLRRLRLPVWVYRAQDNAIRAIEQEILKVKREVYDILEEIARLIEESLEYEHVARVGLFRDAHRRIQEVSATLDVAERMLIDTLKLALVYRVVKSGDTELLQRFLPSSVVSIISMLVRKGCASPSEYAEFIRMITREGGSEGILRSLEELDALYTKLSALRLLVNLKVTEGMVLSKAGVAVCVYVGEQERAESVLARLKKLKLVIAWSRPVYPGKVLILVTAPARLVPEVDEMLAEEGFDALDLTEDAKSGFSASIERYSKLCREKAGRLFKSALLSVIEIKPEDAIWLGEKLGYPDVSSYIRGIEELRARRIEARLLSEEDYETLRMILEESEEAVNAIRDGYRGVEEIKHSLPPSLPEGFAEETLQEVGEFVHAASEFLAYEAFIEAVYKAQDIIRELRIFRTRRVCIADGWVPRRYADQLALTIKKRVPRVLYLKIRDVRAGEQAPTLIGSRGLMKYLAAMTWMRGVPSYWEIDPTPLFATLFIVMYGMMFGDVGLGAIVALGGVALFFSKKRILGMSVDSIKSLGVYAALAGASSVIFGALYGVVFLVQAWKPLFLSPIHDIFEIIAISLWFGVFQLVLGMCLSVANSLMIRDYFEAVFSSTGLLGIAYYLSGVYAAYRFIASGFKFSVVLCPDVLAAAAVALTCLTLVVLAPLMYRRASGEGTALEHMLMNLIEMGISYLSNTISYVRLAAFAVAHEAFGYMALVLSSSVSPLVSYLVANALVLTIEGFVISIQSLRLVFYEFSTKFFRGNGVPYEPIGIRTA